MRVYPTATAAFNNATFALSVPAYTDKPADDIVSGLFAPIYTNSSPWNLEDTRKTAHQMVQLYKMRVNFIFKHDIEIVECLEVIDSYLREVQPLVGHSEKVREYVPLVKPLRDALHKAYRGLLKRNPEWRKSITAEPEIFGILGLLTPVQTGPSMNDLLAQQREMEQRGQPLTYALPADVEKYINEFSSKRNIPRA